MSPKQKQMYGLRDKKISSQDKKKNFSHFFMFSIFLANILSHDLGPRNKVTFLSFLKGKMEQVPSMKVYQELQAKGAILITLEVGSYPALAQ